MVDHSFKFNCVAMYKGLELERAPEGKLLKYHRWAVLSEDPENFDLQIVDTIKSKRYILFKGANLIKTVPGNVHKLCGDFEKSTWKKVSEFCGKVSPLSYREGLAIEHYTALNRYTANLAATKNMRKNAVFESLEPIRSFYKNATFSQRTQILAYVINRITNRAE